MSRELPSRSLGNRTIGNYIIGKNLGQGTFGKVKLGTHSLTGQKVAIKILEKSKISSAADVERVSRQIYILKMVRHPHIIQLYEIIQTPKQLFLVMEYVSDGELFDYIVKRRKLKEVEACQFFRQIIAGVEHLHQIGVVHRDLKPQNLLIDFNRRLKLVDFGLSNTYKPKQQLKTACGSPCYAAPQMIAGKKYNPLNADIWSCGIILFAMICGYLPFEDPNTSVLYKKIMSGQFTIPKYVSESARDFLQGILNVNPETRFTLKDIKSHPWYKQLGDQSSTHGNGLIIGYHTVPVDEDVLQSLKEYIPNIEEVRKFIKTNRHNHSSTLYHLMMKRNLKNGVSSIYDICSNNFDRRLLEHSMKQLNSDNTIQSLNVDRNTTTAIGSRSTSKNIARISHFSQNNNYLSKKKNDSVELKLDLDNLPLVEGFSRRRKLQYKNHKQESTIQSPKNMKHTLYDIQEFTHYNPNPKKLRPPTTYRNPIRNSISRTNKIQQKWETTNRYQSLDNSQQKQIMMKTFMGSIKKGYNSRWENDTQRIRGALNTTISGHSKKRNKIGLFF